MFPDPSSSPAHHTRSLSIRCLPAVTATSPNVDVTSWVRTFRNVMHLHYISKMYERLTWADQEAPLAPFYGFSHTIKSLRLSSTSFEVFDLVCSFPLLEDLALISLRSERGTFGWSAPSTSPKLTGSLDIGVVGGIHSATRRLLDFPDGLPFAKITVSCLGDDLGSASDLVSRCSDTLESLAVYNIILSVSTSTFPIDRYLTAARGHRNDGVST